MSALLDSVIPAILASNQPDAAAKPRKRIKVTPKRRAANRRNSALSTGPKTIEGKSRSRENALKHGLAGAGVVVHAADLRPLEKRLADWTDDLQPGDSVEGWLTGRAALASVRLDRCAREEQVQFLDHAAETLRNWDEARLGLIEEEAEHLDLRPAEVVERLRSVAAGCDWLIRQWTRLERTWKTDGHWNTSALTKVLRLLGQAKLPTTQSSREIVELWTNALAASPTVNIAELDRFTGTNSAHLESAARQAQARARLPEIEQARSTIVEFLRATLRSLTARRDTVWVDIDLPARQHAVDSCLIDDTPCAQTRLRYERANSMEVHRCLTQLWKKQSSEAEEEPAECETATPRTETSASADPCTDLRNEGLRASCAHEIQREAGETQGAAGEIRREAGQTQREAGETQRVVGESQREAGTGCHGFGTPTPCACQSEPEAVAHDSRPPRNEATIAGCHGFGTPTPCACRSEPEPVSHDSRPLRNEATITGCHGFGTPTPCACRSEPESVAHDSRPERNEATTATAPRANGVRMQTCGNGRSADSLRPAGAVSDAHARSDRLPSARRRQCVVARSTDGATTVGRKRCVVAGLPPEPPGPTAVDRVTTEAQ